MENEELRPQLNPEALRKPPEPPAEEHPSTLKEDVSRDAIITEFTPKLLNRSATVASVLTLACIQVWLFASQMLPGSVFFGASPLGDNVFRDITMACSLLVYAGSIVFKRQPLGNWLNVGTVLLIAVPLLIGAYLAAAGGGVSGVLLTAIAAVIFVVYGAALGNAFANWVRLYVNFDAKMPLQIGLSFALSGLMSLGLFSISECAAAIMLLVLPLVIAAMLFYMTRVAQNTKNLDLRAGDREESYVQAPRRLWISLATVGFVVGISFGFVVSDAARAAAAIPWCNVVTVLLGVGVLVYYLVTGKNPGFTVPTSALLAVTCVGQALMSTFGEAFFPPAFAVEFSGLLLFEMVLLLQLPRIYVRIHTLRTFFALWLTLKAAQFAGMLFRYFLASGLVVTPQRWVSAAVLCLAICVMAYALNDRSVSTAWEYFPMHHAPKRRYVLACKDVKDAFGLTPREMEILMLVGRGRNGTYIQERLVISKSTYQTHMRNIYKKMDIHTDQELIDLIEEALDRRKAEEEKRR